MNDTRDKILALAEDLTESDPAIAAILFTLASAPAGGIEDALSQHVLSFAKQALAALRTEQQLDLENRQN